MVEVEDFMKAKPDAIALSAARIISLMKAGGEKITQAFKSLCWRCKGIQVEVTHINLLHQLIVKIIPCRKSFHLTSSLSYYVELVPISLLFACFARQPIVEHNHATLQFSVAYLQFINN